MAIAWFLLHPSPAVSMVDPLLKEYRTTRVNDSQPLSASYSKQASKQAKLTPVVIDNIYIPFI